LAHTFFYPHALSFFVPPLALPNNNPAQYATVVQTIRDASEDQMAQFEHGMRSMAEDVTAAALSAGQTFPFVTVPLFEVPGYQTRDLTGVEFFGWVPFVTAADKDLWLTNYTVEHQGWVTESRKVIGLEYSSYASEFDSASLEVDSSSNDTSTMSPMFWALSNATTADPQGIRESTHPGPYAPVWQTSPPPLSKGFINFDMMSEAYVQRMVPVMLQTRDGLISEVNPSLGRLSGVAVSDQAHQAFHDQFVDSDYTPTPLCTLIRSTCSPSLRISVIQRQPATTRLLDSWLLWCHGIVT
jgi:hypothetical protein